MIGVYSSKRICNSYIFTTSRSDIFSDYFCVVVLAEGHVAAKAECELRWKAKKGIAYMCRDAWNFEKNYLDFISIK